MSVEGVTFEDITRDVQFGRYCDQFSTIQLFKRLIEPQMLRSGSSSTMSKTISYLNSNMREVDPCARVAYSHPKIEILSIPKEKPEEVRNMF